MLRVTRVAIEHLRSSFACRLRGVSLCQVVPWVVLLLLGWGVFDR